MLERETLYFSSTWNGETSVAAGVTKHQKGKWEARIGTMLEKKYK